MMPVGLPAAPPCVPAIPPSRPSDAAPPALMPTMGPVPVPVGGAPGPPAGGIFTSEDPPVPAFSLLPGLFPGSSGRGFRSQPAATDSATHVAHSAQRRCGRRAIEPGHSTDQSMAARAEGAATGGPRRRGLAQPGSHPRLARPAATQSGPESVGLASCIPESPASLSPASPAGAAPASLDGPASGELVPGAPDEPPIADAPPEANPPAPVVPPPEFAAPPVPKLGNPPPLEVRAPVPPFCSPPEPCDGLSGLPLGGSVCGLRLQRVASRHAAANRRRKHHLTTPDPSARCLPPIRHVANR
jgi:hypothetical protein